MLPAAGDAKAWLGADLSVQQALLLARSRAQNADLFESRPGKPDPKQDIKQDEYARSDDGAPEPN